MTNKCKKSVVVLLVALFALSLLMMPNQVSAKANTIHVYADQSIQNAVNVANPGDTIVVHQGIYPESVTVSKPLTLISKGATVVTPPGGDGFYIMAPATVSGFTIQPSSDGRAGIVFDMFYTDGSVAVNNKILRGFVIAGIFIIGPCGVQIKNNEIRSSNVGISLEQGLDVSVTGNVIDADSFGIWAAPGNKITNLEILNNVIHSGLDAAGIFVYPSLGAEGLTIRNNEIHAETTGLRIGNTVDCYVAGNRISAGYGGNGITIEVTSNVVVAGNIIQIPFNLGRGINIDTCENMIMIGNKVAAVDIGIHLSRVTKGIISKNEVKVDNEEPYGDNSLGIVFGQVTDCVASGNIVHGAGCQMLAYESNRIIIKNNELKPNDVGGGKSICLSNIANSYVTGNQVTGEVYYGITLEIGSNSNYILRNIITLAGNPGTVGISLSDDTFGNYVIGNRISGASKAIQDESGLNIIVP